ncbi:MAG: hypothetical protein ABSA82_00380 [Thermacetogeniaceae bacterium]|jgi:hypothetical protein
MTTSSSPYLFNQPQNQAGPMAAAAIAARPPAGTITPATLTPPVTPPVAPPATTAGTTTAANPASAAGPSFTLDDYNQYLASQATPAGPTTAQTAAAQAQAPPNTTWIQDLAPGTYYDSSTGMAMVPLQGGGYAQLNPSQYSIVNGETYLTQDQWNQYQASAYALNPYNPSSDITQQNINDLMSYFDAGQQKALGTQQSAALQSAQEDIQENMTEAQQKYAQLTSNLSYQDYINTRNATYAHRTPGSAMAEQADIGNQFSTDYANAAGNLGTDLKDIMTKGNEGIASLTLAGNTQEAQLHSEELKEVMSFLQTEGNNTAENRQAIVNYYDNLTNEAEKQNLAQYEYGWHYLPKTGKAAGAGVDSSGLTAAKQLQDENLAGAYSDLQRRWWKMVASTGDPSGKKAYYQLYNMIVNGTAGYQAQGINPSTMTAYLEQLYNPGAASTTTTTTATS